MSYDCSAVLVLFSTYLPSNSNISPLQVDKVLHSSILLTIAKTQQLNTLVMWKLCCCYLTEIADTHFRVV